MRDVPTGITAQRFPCSISLSGRENITTLNDGRCIIFSAALIWLERCNDLVLTSIGRTFVNDNLRMLFF